MPVRKNLFLACLALVVVFLALGFIQAGLWLPALGTLLPATVMLLAIKYPNEPLAPLALLFFVGLAAAGILLDASPFWMSFGAIFALAAWDLGLWVHSIQGDITRQVQILESKHFQSLLLVVILGCLAATIGQFLHLRVPFWGILALTLVTFFGLEQMIRHLRPKEE
jgi:hypothetical protein